MDITIRANSVTISNGRNNVEVTLEAIDKDDLLTDEIIDEIGIAEFVDRFGERDVLDYIGKNAAMNHFDLKEEE